MTWWHDGVIYQIYPRSFADSNGDGIGDLPGITARLDYLAELGVDALWLSPFFPSPDVDFGYDVANYTDVDPQYGTLADFDALIAAAHARGLHIILDMVLNHTSDQHPWFQESRKSKDNPYRDWYLWRAKPNNWQSVFGGGGWQLDPLTGEYYFHMFFKQQPDLNWRNPAVRQAILDVFRFWLDRGVDGFRLDVFNAYFKHADLPDQPTAFGLRGFDRLKHVYDMDQPEMMPLLQELRALLAAYPGDRYVVGETFLSSAEKAARYTGIDRLHAAFNFEFLNAPFEPRRMMRLINHWEHLLGEQDWPNYVLNNHDITRTATRWHTGEKDDKLKMAALLLLTLRGTPFLYYGEEIGMRDLRIRRKSEIQDPVGRVYYPFFVGRDGCRSPMQWNGAINAGFCPPNVHPWLPVHADHVTRSLASQRVEPDSLWHFYQQLLAIRKRCAAITQGIFLPIAPDSRVLLAYVRQSKEQTLLVAINFSSREQGLVLGRELNQAHWRVLISSRRPELAEQENPQLLHGGLLHLRGHEAMLLEKVESD